MPSRNSTAAVLLETVLVVMAAAAFAFAANQISPRGLKLGRDYFPVVATPVAALSPTPAPTSVAVTAATTNVDSEALDTDQRIKDKGLQPISRAKVELLTHDPRFQQGLVVIIDARSAAYFADSHIPGAYPLNRYHPEKDLPDVMAACQNAEEIVVYCTGGECEDAEYAALLLRDEGIPIKKLSVYGGGYDDWSANHLPLEQGARNSGLAPTDNK